MKKVNFFCMFFFLAIFGWFILFSCEEIEPGTVREGTIRLMNNSTNVIIVYWSAERGGNPIEESHTRINPGASTTIRLNSGYFYTIYLEDHYGDGWKRDLVYI